MRDVETIKFHIDNNKYHFQQPADATLDDMVKLVPFLAAAIMQGRIDRFDLGDYLERHNLWRYFKLAEAG